jgi:hypothetical protein
MVDFRDAWVLGAGWGALDVGSVRRAGWMMSWPRMIAAFQGVPDQSSAAQLVESTI